MKYEHFKIAVKFLCILTYMIGISLVIMRFIISDMTNRPTDNISNIFLFICWGISLYSLGRNHGFRAGRLDGFKFVASHFYIKPLDEYLKRKEDDKE